MSAPRFDSALPIPPSPLWREALEPDPAGSPRLASYQAPGGEPVAFVLRKFRFTGGQSRDVGEYPFGGLWDSQYLNEKPQAMTVEGYLRGRDYIARRHALVAALRAPTGDAHPGFLELPFWGRIPVVVGGGYEVSEKSDELGQCSLVLPFVRAAADADGGALAEIADRDAAGPESLDAPAERVRAAAVAEFEAEMARRRPPLAVLRSAFGIVTGVLLQVTGRMQAAQGVLNMVTSNVMGIMRLAEQGIASPRVLAQAAFNAGAGIVGAALGIRSAAASYGGGRAFPSLPAADNGRNALVMLMSPGAFAAAGDAATPGEAAALTAAANLGRTVSLVSCCQIMAETHGMTREAALGYWRLLESLADSIDRENPAVYAAITSMLAALSAILSRKGLAAEKTRRLDAKLPLLRVSMLLGCGEEELRRLNWVPDSFVFGGEVRYV